MNATTTSWLLAGALAASLAWNVKWMTRTDSAPLPPANPDAACAAAPDWDQLDLNAAQRAALAGWSASACGVSCELDVSADAKLAELMDALSDPKVQSARLRELGQEVNRARAQSLDACVSSIIEVRRVLTPEQVEKLLRCCAVGGGDAHPSASGH